ncbi:hypothetical protein Btru_058750 [Bulinus truncatus]|nr:hypothetical protein Btru_058750 [Bulinus truncatus]
MAAEEGIPMCHLLILLNFGTLVTIIMLLIKLFDLFLTKHNQMVEKLKYCGKCPCVRSCGHGSLPRMLKNNNVQDSTTLTFSSSSTTSSAPLAPRALSLDDNINGQASGISRTRSVCSPTAIDNHGYSIAAKCSETEASIPAGYADGPHRKHGDETPAAEGYVKASTMLIPAPSRVPTCGNACHESFHMENLLKQIAKFKEVTLSRINELTSRDANKNHSFIWPRHGSGKLYTALRDRSETRPKQPADARSRKNWSEEAVETPARTWQEIMSDYGFKTAPGVEVSPQTVGATYHTTSSIGDQDRGRSLGNFSREYDPYGLIEWSETVDERRGGKCAGGNHLPTSSQSSLKPHRRSYSPVSSDSVKEEPSSCSKGHACPSLEPPTDVLSFRKSDTFGEGRIRSKLPTNMPGIRSTKTIAMESYWSETDGSPYHSPSDHALEGSRTTTSDSANNNIPEKFLSRSQMTMGLDNHTEPSSDDLMKIFNSCYHSNHSGGSGTYNNALTLLQEEKERLEKIDAIISTTSSRQSEAGSDKSEPNAAFLDGSDSEGNRPSSAPNLSNNHSRDFENRIMGKSGSAPPSVKYLDQSTFMEGDRSVICWSYNSTPVLSEAGDLRARFGQSKNRKGRSIVRSFQGAMHRAVRGYHVRRVHRVGYVTKSRLLGVRGRMRRKRGGSKSVQNTGLNEPV